MAKNSCDPIQKSLEWCEGKPNYPGIRRRIYYCNRNKVVDYPSLPEDENGHHTGTGILTGNFVLREGAVFDFIEHLPDKAQTTSKSQGEYPSQSSHDTVVAVYPGTTAEASGFAACIHNTDNVYIIEDFAGHARVIGIEPAWKTKGSVDMDFGQGATGNAGTTITLEGDNRIPFPEYQGKIMTADGEIDFSKN